MRNLAIAALILASSTAYAQQGTSTPAVPPAQPGPVLRAATPDDNSRLDVEIGAVRLTTHSGRYTVAYLPFLAPLQGTAFRSSMEMPNALALTNTTIPQKPYVPRAQILRKR